MDSITKSAHAPVLTRTGNARAVLDDWLRGKAASTRRQYRLEVENWLDWLDDNGADPYSAGDAEAYLADVLDERRCLPSTLDRLATILRGFVAHGLGRAQLPAEGNPWLAADTGRVVPPDYGGGSPTNNRRHRMTDGEVADLLAACDPGTPEGARDLALISAMLYTGSRVGALLAADASDVRREGSGTGRRVSITVRQKGQSREDPTVLVMVGDHAGTRAIDAWLNDHLLPMARRGAAPADPPLFVTLGGYSSGQRLSYAGARKAFDRCRAAAGVGHFTIHDLRRTAAMKALDRGASLTQLQAMLNHKSVTTTEQYVREALAAEAPATGLICYGEGVGNG